MKAWQNFTLGVALGLVVIGVRLVFAADMPLPMPPAIQKLAPVVTQFASGWYVRGEVGSRVGLRWRFNDLRLTP